MSYSEPPPPQYGAPQPPYGGGVPQKNSGMAIAGLVLGIIGIIPCFWSCFIFGILGVVFGQLGKKDVRDSNGTKKGENLAQWGFILGAVAIGLGILYWVLVAADVINVSYYSDMN